MRERSIAGLEGEVEILQGLSDRQVGGLERDLHPPLLAAGELGLQQAIDEAVGRDLLAYRLAQQVLQLLGCMAAAEGDQPVARRVDIELRPHGGHRATSARAA